MRGCDFCSEASREGDYFFREASIASLSGSTARQKAEHALEKKKL